MYPAYYSKTIFLPSGFTYSDFFLNLHPQHTYLQTAQYPETMNLWWNSIYLWLECQGNIKITHSFDFNQPSYCWETAHR